MTTRICNANIHNLTPGVVEFLRTNHDLKGAVVNFRYALAGDCAARLQQDHHAAEKGNP